MSVGKKEKEKVDLPRHRTKVDLLNVRVVWAMLDINKDLLIHFEQGEHEYTLRLTFSQVLKLLYDLAGKYSGKES